MKKLRLGLDFLNMINKGAVTARQQVGKSSGTISTVVESVTPDQGESKSKDVITLTGNTGGASVVPFVRDTTPPGVPIGVSVSTIPDGAVVTWDGTLDGGIPSDFAGIQIAVDGAIVDSTLTKEGSIPLSLSPGAHNVKARSFDQAHDEDLLLAPNYSEWTSNLSLSVGAAVSAIVAEYAVGDSETVAPDDGWSTNSPVWESGKFVWSRTKTTRSDGVFYSDPVCIQGAQGVGVASIVPQYYLSTSSSSQAGGSWEAEPAAWVSGRYYWTRSYITWSDGTTATTTPVLDRATTTANQNATNANNAAQSAYRIVSNTGSIERTPAGEINPASLSVAAYHPVGTTQTLYSGRWKIEASSDQSTWTNLYTSTANESSKTLALTDVTAAHKFVRVSLYAANGTTTLLQQATLGIVEATGNYLVHNSNGLFVVETEGDPNTGGALRLASDAIEMLKDGNVLMRIAAALIELGVNSATAVIKLCGGMGQIGFDTNSNQLYIGSEEGSSLHLLDNDGHMSEAGIGIVRDSATKTRGFYSASEHDFWGKMTLNGKDAEGDVLFSSESGATGDIVLSKSAANYEYLELFYRLNNEVYVIDSTRIHNPNGRIASLGGGYYAAANIIQFTTCTYLVNGTSLGRSNNFYVNLGADGSYGGASGIRVMRVTGF